VTDFGLKLNISINLNDNQTHTFSNLANGDEILSVDTQGKNYNMLATYYNGEWFPRETAFLMPGVGYLFLKKSDHESTRSLSYVGNSFEGTSSFDLEESTIISFSPMISSGNKTVQLPRDCFVTQYDNGVEIQLPSVEQLNQKEYTFEHGRGYRILTNKGIAKSTYVIV
jgi:hypothetical protein